LWRLLTRAPRIGGCGDLLDMPQFNMPQIYSDEKVYNNSKVEAYYDMVEVHSEDDEILIQ
jgi:hypothetical protein